MPIFGFIASAAQGIYTTLKYVLFGTKTGDLYSSNTLGATNTTAIVGNPLSTWTSRISNFGSTLWAIDYSTTTPTTYVVGGNSGTIRSSTDAITWTTRTSNFGTSQVRTIRYTNGIFIAGGENGALRTSTDGITWTTRTSNTLEYIFGAAYGNGTYVIVGSTGMIRSSTNATTWTTRTSNFDSSLMRVVYGANLFVAVGLTGAIRTSTDGITWTTRTSNLTTENIRSIDYGNSTFVIGADGGQMRKSTDGITWTTITTPNFGVSTITSLKYTDGLWVAGGYGGWATMSTDTVTWTTVATNFGGNILLDMTINDGLVVPVATGGLISTSVIPKINDISSSTDGIGSTIPITVIGGSVNTLQQSTNLTSWTSLNPDFGTNSVKSVDVGGQSAAALGDSWYVGSRFSLPAENLTSVKYANSRFVVGNYYGVIYDSTDGTTWTSNYRGTSNVNTLDSSFGIRSIDYGNSNWLAAGYFGYIHRTSNADATGWTSVVRITGNPYLHKIKYGNTWVVAGYKGYLFTSSDNGSTWTSRNSGFSSSSSSRIYGLDYDSANSLWAAVGSLGQIATSTDATTWTARTSTFTTTIRSVKYANNLWVAVGVGGTVIKSTDAVTWTTQSTPTTVQLWDIQYIDNKWVAVGYTGSSSEFLSSTDAVSWVLKSIPGQGIKNLDGTSNIIYAGGSNNIYSKPSNVNFKTITAGSSNGIFKMSTDAVTWTTGTYIVPSDYEGSTSFGSSITSTPIIDATTVNDNKILAGSNGLILQSNQASNSLAQTKVVYNRLGLDYTQVNTTPNSIGFVYFIGYENDLYIYTGNLNEFATSTDAITWTKRTCGISDLTSITYGNGTWVATNAIGTIATSTDLSTWTTRTSNFGSSTVWRARYANGVWVAVGAGGTIRTSTNATTWTTRTSNVTGVLYDAKYVNGAWFTFGDLSYLYTRSTDNGSSWTRKESGFSFSGGEARDIAYGNGMHVMVRSGNTSPSNNYLITTSTDATTWTSRYLPAAYGMPSIYNVYYTGSRFIVFVGSNMFSSTDGISWDVANTNVSGSPSYFAYGNSKIFYIGNYTTTVRYSENSKKFNSITQLSKTVDNKASVVSSGEFYTSNDLQTYSKQNLRMSELRPYNDKNIQSGNIFNNSVFFGDTHGRVLSTTDGATWTSTNIVAPSLASWTTVNITSIASENNNMVAVSDYGYIAKTTNGTTWTASVISNGRLTDVEYADGKWVAVGHYGNLYTSTDTITWVTRTANFASASTTYTGTFNAIAYSGTAYVAGGASSNGFFRSTDSIAWTQIYTGNGSFSNTTIRDVIYGNNKFIAISNRSNTVLSSTNEINWYPVEALRLTTIAFRVGYGNGFYMVSSETDPSVVSFSTDTITWTTRNTGIGLAHSLEYGNGIWVAAGDSGGLSTSTDTITWTSRTSTITSTITNAKHADGIWVAAGYGGNIRTSTDAITWTTRTSNFGTTNIRGLGYGNGVWVAVGNAGTIRTSSDNGSSWTTRTSPTTQSIIDVNYYNGSWIASAGNGNILKSTDATTWTSSQISFTPQTNIFSIAYDGSKWVAAGASGQFRESTDTITWTTMTTTGITSGDAVAYYVGNEWIGGGSNGLYTSTDALTWTSRYSLTIQSVTKGTTLWYAVGSSEVAYSTDTITWTKEENVVTRAWTSALYDSAAGRYWFGGGNAYVIASSDQQLSDSSANYHSEGVVVGNDGLIFKYYSSVNGYVPLNTNISDNFSKTLYNNEAYILLGSNATYSSSDLITWTTVTPAAAFQISALGSN